MAASKLRFTPPFCPNADCKHHQNPEGWRFVRWGHYLRTCPTLHSVPRFRCTHCRRTFSRQTFQTTYWLRRPELLHTICERLLSGSGLRQITRFLHCATTTVMTHAARLGRQALLVLEANRPRAAPREPIAIDGFESFAFSQYYPLHLNLVVGADSHFAYAFTESELRRKGRMTVAQKRKRVREEASVGRADPKSIERGMAEAVALAVPPGTHACVRSDEHRAYPRSLGRLADRSFDHEMTSSKAARTTRNPLFPVNRQDLMLRHTGANHRRETIAFSKTRAGVIERAALQLVFMNYMKSLSEKKKDSTPAMRLGITDHKWTVEDFLGERHFASRIDLPPVWQAYYERRIKTRRLPQSKPHQLRYAF